MGVPGLSPVPGFSPGFSRAFCFLHSLASPDTCSAGSEFGAARFLELASYSYAMVSPSTGENISPPLCSVVIATWNRRKEVQAALDSVFAQTIAPRLEVIVVDNASEDSTVSWLQEEYGRPIRLLRFAKNMGGSHARNAAVRLAQSRYVCFLDSDAVLLSPEVIQTCLEYISAHPEIRAVAAPVWFDRQKTKGFCLGGHVTPDGHFDGRRTRSHQSEDPMFLSTCFSVWEKGLIEELRGFDPWYFWGIEDLDLGLRAWHNARRGRARGATRFHVVEGVDVLHEMASNGRHYDFRDFNAVFKALEWQRLYLVLSYGGVTEFFRVMFRTPFRIARMERDGWEKKLSFAELWRALAAYPLRHLLALPWDIINTRRDHLARAPVPEELPIRRSS